MVYIHSSEDVSYPALFEPQIGAHLTPKTRKRQDFSPWQLAYATLFRRSNEIVENRYFLLLLPVGLFKDAAL